MAVSLRELDKRIAAIERANQREEYWVILPHWEDQEGIQMVRNARTKETVTREVFDALEVDSYVIDIEVEFV